MDFPTSTIAATRRPAEKRRKTRSSSCQRLRGSFHHTSGSILPSIAGGFDGRIFFGAAHPAPTRKIHQSFWQHFARGQSSPSGVWSGKGCGRVGGLRFRRRFHFLLIRRIKKPSSKTKSPVWICRLNPRSFQELDAEPQKVPKVFARRSLVPFSKSPTEIQACNDHFSNSWLYEGPIVQALHNARHKCQLSRGVQASEEVFCEFVSLAT